MTWVIALCIAFFAACEKDGHTARKLTPKEVASALDAKMQILLADTAANQLLWFDPAKNTFDEAMQLDCMTEEIGTPFSMSVDYAGRAWVLANSGRMVIADPETKSCEVTDITTGMMFALTFAPDGEGGENLFIAVDAGEATIAQFLRVDIDQDFAIHELAPLTATTGVKTPELAATADGQIYTYWPGAPASIVQQISQTGGHPQRQWNVAAVEQGGAWTIAYAQGHLFLFPEDGDRNKVMKFSPETGKLETVVNDSPFEIVGASAYRKRPLAKP